MAPAINFYLSLFVRICVAQIETPNHHVAKGDLEPFILLPPPPTLQVSHRTQLHRQEQEWRRGQASGSLLDGSNAIRTTLFTAD